MENQIEQTSEEKAVSPVGKILDRLKLRSKKIRIIASAIFIVILALVGYYFYSRRDVVYAENAEISAPIITLSPSSPDILQEILVKEGERVTAREPVAKMQNGFVRAETNGIIAGTDNEVGKIFSPGEAVVTMVDTDDLRVVAHVEENKGFSRIKVGQKVTFTVDAFGSEKFYGTVDEIAETADQSSVVFSISDERQEKDFSVKIKYNVYDYPQLLDGMSARVWIDTK